MSKHTSGAWGVLNARKEDWLGRPLEYWTVTAKENDQWICASPEWDPEHDEESTANAQLIAAAPELLEALEESFDFPADFFDRDDMDVITITVTGRHLRMVRAAIAKARGEA